jgi:hypothetical protein
MEGAMRALVPCLLLALVACGTSPAQRTGQTPSPDVPVEAEVVRHPTDLRLDHAWVQDAADATEQAARRAAMERLRSAVERGASFDAAWKALGVAPGPWHVGEGETYPYDVLPEGARDLPVGSLSPILPGNGGLHLFRILAREFGG